MRPEGKGYFLKEYGSWSVLLIAYVIGLGVSRAVPWQAVPVLASLALLVNSKQAYSRWVRQPSVKAHLMVFLGQVAVASVVLTAVYAQGLSQLLPLLLFPAAYLLSNRLAGEHALATELLGFALLSLAAVLARFLVVEGVDIRLFAGTALYFTAGVFKVKAVLFRKTVYRVTAVLYILLAAFIYDRFSLSLVALLPLLENAYMAVTLYKVPLQTTGWIEVVKSIMFLALFIATF